MEAQVFSHSSQRSFSPYPRKEDTSKLECEYNVSGPINCKKPNSEKVNFLNTASCFLMSLQGKLLLNFCPFFPLHISTFGLPPFFNSWKIPPTDLYLKSNK